jgi:transcriptional regulator with XRE-family HTH domain
VIALVDPAGMDDQRVGASLRALRLRRRVRQKDVSVAAGIPRGVAILIEAGKLDRVRFGDIRRYAKALGARFDGSVLWQGADLDRMLNRGHARLHEAAAIWLAGVGGWLVVPEVSFSHSGDRGVIDIVAWHSASRTLLIIELKTRIVDINNLMATMDIRGRVATRIATGRGWDPKAIGLWVVVAPTRTNARILADHATVLRAKFPGDGRTIRRWLANPSGSVAVLSFMPQIRLGNLGRDATTPSRIRRTSASVAEPSNRSNRSHEPRIGVAFRD